MIQSINFCAWLGSGANPAVTPHKIIWFYKRAWKVLQEGNIYTEFVKVFAKFVEMFL